MGEAGARDWSSLMRRRDWALGWSISRMVASIPPLERRVSAWAMEGRRTMGNWVGSRTSAKALARGSLLLMTRRVGI